MCWSTDLRAATPRVLVIQTASKSADTAREQRFIGELRLVLDGIEVKAARAGLPGFELKGLGEQLPVVRRLLGKIPSLAAVWLSRPGPNLLLLHLVSVSTGRALVRIVETRLDSHSERKLALAARELLGTAYLLAPPSKRRHKAVAKVVAGVRKKAAFEPRSSRQRDKTRSRRDWSLKAAGCFSIGVWGQSPYLTMGTGSSFDAELRLSRRWMARLRLDIVGRPLGEIAKAAVKGMGIDPGVEAGPFFCWGASCLVLFAGVRFSWNVLWIKPSDSEQVYRHSMSEIRVVLGLELRWRISRRISLGTSLELQAAPDRHRFHLESSRQAVLTTPWLSMGYTLGILVHP